jgi:pimeloyl-ACP methyl ester carboxylesterase
VVHFVSKMPVLQSSIEKFSKRTFAPSPGGKPADPSIDYNDKIVIVNKDGIRLETLTLGLPANPCVIIPPGGGATKENSLFWARDLASLGFFVIMYDVRNTGGSQKTDVGSIFGSQYTDPLEEMFRIMAKQSWKDKAEEKKKRQREGHDTQNKKHLNMRDLVRQAKGKTISNEDLYNPHIMNAIYDHDDLASDAVRIMDEFGVQKAHVMGLSQGGFLSQLIAMQHPDRVLTCVSAGAAFESSGIELAAFTEEAAEFHRALKTRNLVDEDGNPPFDEGTVTQQAYVDYKAAFLQEALGGVPSEICDEMAVREWASGRSTPQDNALSALAFYKWERYEGKLERHRKQLGLNRVPLFIIHGKKRSNCTLQPGRNFV